MNEIVYLAATVIIVCMAVVTVILSVMLIYLLFAHGKDVYDEFRRSGRWLK
jgi:hypothetical protein